MKRRKQLLHRRFPVGNISLKEILFFALGVVIFASLAFVLMHIPRTAHVSLSQNGTPNASPLHPTTTDGGTHGTAGASTSYSGTYIYADPPNPLPSVNRAAYNAKVLALAHIPPAPTAPPRRPATTTVTTTTTVGSTTFTITSTVLASSSVSSSAASTPSASSFAATSSHTQSTVEQFPPYPAAPSRAQIAARWPVPISRAPYPTAGAILPFHRVVAYYGNFYSANMGILGEYSPAKVLSMLTSTAAMWQKADPSTPVIPAIDYIAVTAQASPGPNHMYRARMPASQIEKAISMANEINGLVILDVQVGDSNVQTEIPLLKKYLELPQVELALDPEFAMHNGQRPGTVVGTMDASSINWTARYLANIVTTYHLPPKILIVHRWTIPMVTNADKITPLPQVQVVMDMDGFGSPAKKIGTYYSAVEPYPVQFTGFKLFYKNDAKAGHLMTPKEVLRLSPQPIFIQYE